MVKNQLFKDCVSPHFELWTFLKTIYLVKQSTLSSKQVRIFMMFENDFFTRLCSATPPCV